MRALGFWNGNKIQILNLLSPPGIFSKCMVNICQNRRIFDIYLDSFFLFLQKIGRNHLDAIVHRPLNPKYVWAKNSELPYTL